MQNKSKSWTDVQLIISSVSVALTLGFWSLFSSTAKLKSGVTDSTDFGSQLPTTVAQTSSDLLLPGQILLLGGAQGTATPSALSAQTQQLTKPKSTGGTSTKKSGGVTSTSSSHP